jgi:hypothetical protein
MGVQPLVGWVSNALQTSKFILGFAHFYLNLYRLEEIGWDPNYRNNQYIWHRNNRTRIYGADILDVPCVKAAQSH